MSWFHFKIRQQFCAIFFVCKAGNMYAKQVNWVDGIIPKGMVKDEMQVERIDFKETHESHTEDKCCA